MNRAILIFLSTAYALAIAIGAAVALTGGHKGGLAGLGYAAMFVPSIAVLVVRFTIDEGPRICWSRVPLRYLPLALLLIPGVLHAMMLPVAAALEGGLHWQDWLTPQADGLYHTPDRLGWGALTAGGLAARIAINAVAGLIVVSMLALFEEIGWRGWLLPRLLERMNARRAIVAVAALWALWHVPFVLSGIYFDLDSSRKALLSAVTVPVADFAFGLVIGWLWVRTESIWIAALAHGALNNWGQYAFKYMRDFVVADDAVVLGAGVLGVLVVGAAMLARLPASNVPSHSG